MSENISGNKRYFCCTDQRRKDIQNHATLNGIDFLEVLDDEKEPLTRQRILFLHLLKPVKANALSKSNILLKGGIRINDVQVIGLTPDVQQPLLPPDTPCDVFIVEVNKPGDFSNYTLSVVDNNLDASPKPYQDFDQIMYHIDFRFKVACDNGFDCMPSHICPPEASDLPLINYLAKDYASFRQLMLDRMSLLAPEWKERNPADLGITLIELLAYVADHLSYKQDAIASEAYLATARKRSAVKRHARLVDYRMHDGCNARCWVQIQIDSKAGPIGKVPGELANLKFVSKAKNFPAFLNENQLNEALKLGAIVFEPLNKFELFPEHNEMYFHTWGQSSCCLPKGSTSATLAGNFPNLKPGNILILAERLGADTGAEPDADPQKRQAVKITKINYTSDALYMDPENKLLPKPLTEIEWHSEDALNFPLCISNEVSNAIGVAWGNIVPADHGRTIEDPPDASSLYPDTVPKHNLVYAAASNLKNCDKKEPDRLPLRYRPYLKKFPLTQAAEFDPENLKKSMNFKAEKYQSALRYMRWDMHDVLPAIRITESSSKKEWTPLIDLLNAGSNHKNFTVETEMDGISYLRFGDGTHGERPKGDTKFTAKYRLGNGTTGNFGYNVLGHLFTTDPAITGIKDSILKIWNPLPATGGLEPENMETVRQYAPEAFKTQLRAVTNADYEYFAQKINPEVQRAAATMRWTGSWNTVFLSVDRFNGDDISQDFEDGLRYDLEKYRMAGFDLEVDGPQYVNLEVEISICVKPGYRNDHVKNALLQVFGSKIMPKGNKGFFHPDNFTFGQALYMSNMYAAAAKIEGILSFDIVKMCRQGDEKHLLPDKGIFETGRREIIRCDNDPNFPDRGKLTVLIKN